MTYTQSLRVNRFAVEGELFARREGPGVFASFHATRVLFLLDVLHFFAAFVAESARFSVCVSGYDGFQLLESIPDPCSRAARLGARQFLILERLQFCKTLVAESRGTRGFPVSDVLHRDICRDFHAVVATVNPAFHLRLW